MAAAYILNRTGPTSVEGKTPYELWYGREPNIDHLRVFGTECFVHIPKEKRSKWDSKAKKGRLVGYVGDKDGYRVWIPEIDQVILSHDVIFKDEPISTSIDVEVFTGDNGLQNEKLENDENIAKTEDEDIEKSCESVTDEDLLKEPSHSLRERSNIKRPSKFDGFSMLASAFEPPGYQSAIHSDETDFWKKAMDEEMSSLKENKVWELVKLPAGRKAIDNRWVYSVKQNLDGSVNRYKARLVAKGYSQKEGLDYEETFSPVARFDTIRSVLSIAASEKLHLEQFDVKTAFLYGKLNEEIFMKQPEGFEDGSDRVCKLKRSLYGLKQSSRCWNERFTNVLKNFGLVSSDADPCVFVRNLKFRKLIVVLYVDDGLIASSREDDCKYFLEQLRREFEITSYPVSCYLGIQIKQREDGTVFVTQEAYAEKVLKKFNMAEATAVGTPIEKILDFDQENTECVSDKVPYRAAVGSLMYLATGTRPDIAYAVSVVSQRLEKPTVGDWNAVKRILRYIKGTTGQGILYRTCKSCLEIFSDADYAGEVNGRRSTSGTVCKFADGAITWMSQKQKSVSLSTTEAEIVAASEATKDAIWLKRLFSDIDVLIDIPVLNCDNAGTVKLAKNPEFHRRTKHIEVRHFFVREKFLSGEIRVEHIAGENQVADILTKPLPKPRFMKLRSILGLKLEK